MHLPLRQRHTLHQCSRSRIGNLSRKSILVLRQGIFGETECINQLYFRLVSNSSFGLVSIDIPPYLSP